MIRLLLLAALFATPAYAQQSRIHLPILPPFEYDHPYLDGQLTITTNSQAEIRQRCPFLKVPYAYGRSQMKESKNETSFIDHRRLRSCLRHKRSASPIMGPRRGIHRSIP
jgi:hypothetical protein